MENYWKQNLIEENSKLFSTYKIRGKYDINQEKTRTNILLLQLKDNIENLKKLQKDQWAIYDEQELQIEIDQNNKDINNTIQKIKDLTKMEEIAKKLNKLMSYEDLP